MTETANNAKKTWDCILDALSRWSHLGVQDQSNGTRLIGRVPHVAPMAWFHELYRGLDFSELESLEKRLDAPLPDEFREFLTFSNGLNAFSDTLKIFGMRRTRTRSATAAQEPYDLLLETVHTRPLPGLICFGGIGDESLYCRWESGRQVAVFSCPRSKVEHPTRTWPGFWTMLSSEVSRLTAQFDGQGRHMRE